jgi:hypothetical protein
MGGGVVMAGDFRPRRRMTASGLWPGYFIVATPSAPAAGMRWVSSVFAKYKMDFAMMDDFSAETGRKNTATVKYPG